MYVLNIDGYKHLLYGCGFVLIANVDLLSAIGAVLLTTGIDRAYWRFRNVK